MAACYRCGAEAGSARFCTNCGTDLASAPPAVQASPLGAGPPPPVATPRPTSTGHRADTRGTGPGRQGLGRKKILLIAGVCAAVGLAAAAAVTIAVTTGTDDPSAQPVPVSAAAPDASTSAPASTSAGGASPTPGTLVTLGGPPGSARSTSRTSATGPVRSITPQSATASSTAPSSVDDAGVTTTYDAHNAIDGNPATAWRPTEGDGVGQELVLRLPASTTVASVGLVPGYAKTDPATGVDRFAQNRTIARVSWTFDDGTSVQQDFRADRTMQTIPVSATTSTVRLKILQTLAPAATADPRNYAPISEVSLSGAS